MHAIAWSDSQKYVVYKNLRLSFTHSKTELNQAGMDVLLTVPCCEGMYGVIKEYLKMFTSCLTSHL